MMIDVAALQEQLEKLKRGTAEIVPESDFALKLEKSAKEGKPLRVKLGIDPTAPDIHLGHSVVLRKLRKFQDFGHKVILIIGDFTARIGDPTGRSETRKVLAPDEIKQNTETYLNQIGKILNTQDPSRFELRYNSEWLSRLTFAEVVSLAHHFTVAQLLEREDFAKRYAAGKAIGLHEFFYPIMQGYDSVAIQCDVELGGTDQKFNILVGRELQRIFGMKEPQTAFLLPILEGLDGVQKMSKSLGNYIGINESAEEMFGKVMRIPDALMPRYYELLTDAPMSDIEKLKKALDGKPQGEVDYRDWKARLGEEIASSYHGHDQAKSARENFDRIFREKQAPEEIPTYASPAKALEGMPLARFLITTEPKLAESIREARRLIAQGAVEVDGEIVRDESALLNARNGMVVKVGKRRFIKLLLGQDNSSSALI